MIYDKRCEKVYIELSSLCNELKEASLRLAKKAEEESSDEKLTHFYYGKAEAIADLAFSLEDNNPFN